MRKQVLDDARVFDGLFRFLGLTSLGGLKSLCRKGLERVRLEALTSLQPHLNLTLTSLQTHFKLTRASLNILRYKGMFENVHFNNSERAFLGGKIC